MTATLNYLLAAQESLEKRVEALESQGRARYPTPICDSILAAHLVREAKNAEVR